MTKLEMIKNLMDEKGGPVFGDTTPEQFCKNRTKKEVADFCKAQREWWAYLATRNQ